jgi:integrase
MAYVWKHPNSPFWTASYRDDFNRWRKKSTKHRSRSKALALALEWERAAGLGRERILTESKSREIIGGILERTSGEKLRQTTLREFCAEWLRGKSYARQDGTATRYTGSVDKLLTFLGKKAEFPIAAITPPDCQRYHDHLLASKLAPATVRVEMKTVAAIFNHARRLGLIATNPAASVELPERIRQVKRKTFTPAQVELLLKEARGEWRTVILLGYCAGLRLSDAVGLTWDAVDFAGNCLKVQTRKTDDYLEIPMHPALHAHLSRLAGDSGGPICSELAAVSVGGRSGLSKQFLAIMRRAGISNEAADTGGQRQLSQLSFHALRASFNSALANKGVDQELRRKLTGHKSDAVNDRYTQHERETLRTAVEKLPALKLP